MVLRRGEAVSSDTPTTSEVEFSEELSHDVGTSVCRNGTVCCAPHAGLV